MSTAGRVVALAIAALIGVESARGEVAERDCLPADLKLRVAFSEPKRLAAALRASADRRGRAEKRALLLGRFREAGCVSVEEQMVPGLSEPNLVCRIPGTTAEWIALGTSPAIDGWPSAVLLPEIARAVGAEPRAHGYAIASLARRAEDIPSGARAFADSFAAPPRVFVHLGSLGRRAPKLAPDVPDDQRCLVDAVARAVVGAPILRIDAWEHLALPLCGSRPTGGILRSPRTAPVPCQTLTVGKLLDTHPFRLRGVPTVGFYDFAERNQTAHFDPATYVLSYRLIAAYAVALDELVESPPQPVAP